MARKIPIDTASYYDEYIYKSDRSLNETMKGLDINPSPVFALLKRKYPHYTRFAGTKSLDIGCGLGRNFASLLSLAESVEAFDESLNAVNRSIQKARALRATDKISIRQANFHEIFPYPNDYFDLILDSTTIFPESPLVEQIPSALSEVYRVLKPGAIMISELIDINDPFATHWEKGPLPGTILWKSHKTSATKIDRIISLHDATRYYKEAGFDILESTHVIEPCFLEGETWETKHICFIVQKPFSLSPLKHLWYTTRKLPHMLMPQGRKTPQIRRSRIDWTQSYTSLLLGIVVVVVGILFVASIIREHRTQKNQQTSSISTQKINPTPTPAPFVYTVNAGDNLWDIADKTYHDGFKWTEIAKLNNISSPYNIDPGQVLQLPEINPAQSFGQILSSDKENNTNSQIIPASDSITLDTYTVQHGDNLWEIAVRAYADGYRWPDIAKANNLSNPGLIFSGNVLKIPRPGKEFMQ